MADINLLSIALCVFLAGFVAIELGVTTAIVEITFGIAAGNIFSIQPTEVTEILARIGIIVLMYLAGLEMNFSIFRKNIRPSIAIGASSFIVPFTTIFILSRYALALTAEQSLLAAIALSATSIAVVYAILAGKKDHSIPANAIISSAMLTDLFSMTALGVLFSNFSMLTVAMIAAIALISYFFPYLGKSIFKRFKGNVVAFEFRLMLLMLLGLAFMAEAAGIEAMLVAFFFGMGTSDIVVKHEALEKQLRAIAFGFLTPIFFFTTGAKISFGALQSGFMPMLVFLAASFAAKYATTYYASRKFFPKHAKYISGLFCANLSIGIVAATYGLSSGIFTPSIYSAVVGAVVISTIMASALTKEKMPSL